MKLVHVSDVHIGASFKSASYAKDLASLRQLEIKESFFNVLEYCNQNKVDILLISGDLFDSKYVKKSDIDSIVYKLSHLHSKVFMIAGNHDPIISDSYWKYFQNTNNIHVFHSELSFVELPELELRIYGHSWDTYSIEESILDQIPPLDNSWNNILIAHGEVGNKKTKYLPIDIPSLQDKKFDYVALGHIHKHEVFGDNIAYAGSLEPFDFSETGDHGFVEVEIIDKKTTIQFIPFAKRNFVVIPIELSGDLSDVDIIQVMKQYANENDLVRFIFTGRYHHEITISNDYFREVLGEYFFYLECKNNARIDFDIDDILKQNKGNIIEKYITRFQSMDLTDEHIRRAFEIGLEELLLVKEGKR